MRISDWSSDVCSSDLALGAARREQPGRGDLDRPRALPTGRPPGGEKTVAHRQVGGEALPRRRAQRHHALLAALALDDEQALVALGGREAQADQLRDAQAAGVAQPDKGGEAQRLRPFPPVRLVQKHAAIESATGWAKLG